MLQNISQFFWPPFVCGKVYIKAVKNKTPIFYFWSTNRVLSDPFEIPNFRKAIG